MTKKYEKHQRDYTIIGITSVFDGFMNRDVESFYGSTFSEIISVIKDGVYYHFEVVEDKEKICRNFLSRIHNNDEVDLENEYQKYDEEVTKYEKLITQSDNDFSLDIILYFYRFYKDLIRISYLAMDAIDFIDMLDIEKCEEFKDWATRVRRRGEVIYKKGESEFIPKFLEWLHKKYVPDIAPNFLQYITHVEMIQFVTKKIALPSIEELHERKRFLYVRQYPYEQLELLSGDLAKEKIETERLLESAGDGFEHIRKLRGQTAFSGIVRGRVCVIRSRIELDKFQDGDVIVSQMTDPSYLPIMKRASAFVTNEGGMLCHAAIVARELGKPCVVGTKYATHVFRNGELVEVDATNGIVRKINL